MPYYTGSIAAVPTARRQDYIDYARAAWPVFRDHGAERMVETWGVDVPHGHTTDFHRAVEAGEDETVVFSWIAWPDRATCDAAWQAMDEDGSMASLPEMPFDGSRMIYGGFAPVLEAGQTMGSGYYQGFALAVPAENRAVYSDTTRQGWETFGGYGAGGVVEAWGEDVPRGRRTDFYRATKAIEGEVPAFSWIAWPDRATCDWANEAMQAAGADQDFTELPFDGKRMMWAGFEPIFDSGAGD